MAGFQTWPLGVHRRLYRDSQKGQPSSLKPEHCGVQPFLSQPLCLGAGGPQALNPCREDVAAAFPALRHGSGTGVTLSGRLSPRAVTNFATRERARGCRPVHSPRFRGGLRGSCGSGGDRSTGRWTFGQAVLSSPWLALGGVTGPAGAALAQGRVWGVPPHPPALQAPATLASSCPSISANALLLLGSDLALLSPAWRVLVTHPPLLPPELSWCHFLGRPSPTPPAGVTPRLPAHALVYFLIARLMA